MVREGDVVPDILYHYTSIDAFRNIIESKKMWATRYDRMEDRSEVHIGIDSVVKVVKEHEAGNSGGYKDFLISAIESYGRGGLQVYVLSLSGDADSPSQWKEYTPLGGVAIGFDSQKVRKGFLCPATKRPQSENQLLQCRYIDKDKYSDLQTFVEEQFFKPNSYCAMFGQQGEIGKRIFCATLSVTIYQTVCSIKDRRYEPENEWRCVNWNPHSDTYPVRRRPGKCYIEMVFAPEDYIREVWISPYGDRADSERAVTDCRHRNGLHFAIRSSKIPYPA
jgi:hypothetical protein